MPVRGVQHVQHLVDTSRVRKLTTVFVAMGGVVGEFRIEQRTAHADGRSDAECSVCCDPDVAREGSADELTTLTTVPC